VKKEYIGEKLSSRYVQEINIAWDNICSYIQLAFPKVWYALRVNEVICEDTIDINLLHHSQDLTKKIHSCKQAIEVFRTIIYGGSLRISFSQNKQIQKLFSDLLFACQTTDVPGINLIASQKRIAFLQNWIEKLVLKSSLPSFLIKNIICDTGTITPNLKKKEPAQVTDKKFTVTKLSRPRINLLQSNKDIATNSQSSQSLNTTFSSYIDRQTKPPNFVGIKIKFDSDTSSSESDTENSVNSIWNPVFKKRKTL